MRVHRDPHCVHSRRPGVPGAPRTGRDRGPRRNHYAVHTRSVTSPSAPPCVEEGTLRPVSSVTTHQTRVESSECESERHRAPRLGTEFPCVGRDRARGSRNINHRIRKIEWICWLLRGPCGIPGGPGYAGCIQPLSGRYVRSGTSTAGSLHSQYCTSNTVE